MQRFITAIQAMCEAVIFADIRESFVGCIYIAVRGDAGNK